MQASNEETKGLGVTVGGRQPSWEKTVVGMSATLCHMVATVERRSCTCGCLCDCLSEVFSLVGRSSRGDSNGEVIGRTRRRKSFPAVEMI